MNVSGGVGAREADRWALVTGASSGIGEAFARELGARGRAVVLVARRADRLEALVRELGGDGRALAVPLDLAAAGAGEQLQALLRARGLEVDLLVNNAGIGHTGRFHEEPVERVLAMVDLNVRALVDLTRRFVPPMVARGSGAVVNVASMASFQPVPFLAVYAATKAFVLSFTEALSDELAGTGVRAQALCPGNIPTEFQRTAGTAGLPFDRTPATAPRVVAAASLDALERGPSLVIPGARDRATVALQRLVPRRWVRRIAGGLFRPVGSAQ
jgi:short-subunit dehydrogenase